MLPSRNRLKKNSQILGVLRNGKRTLLGDFLFIYLPNSDEFRFAVVVKKKDIKSAVLRNRIKRVIIETLRNSFPYKQATGDLLVVSNLKKPEEVKFQFTESLKKWQQKK